MKKEVCRQLAKQHGVEIQFTADNVPFLLPEDLKLCFYRVAREALNNSMKYSRAACIELKLIGCDDLLRMTIKDYGTGFDPPTATRGLGLATMRERLRLVGGQLLINSRPGQGTEVRAQARLEDRRGHATVA